MIEASGFQYKFLCPSRFQLQYVFKKLNNCRKSCLERGINRFTRAKPLLPRFLKKWSILLKKKLINSTVVGNRFDAGKPVCAAQVHIYISFWGLVVTLGNKREFGNYCYNIRNIVYNVISITRYPSGKKYSVVFKRKPFLLGPFCL